MVHPVLCAIFEVATVVPARLVVPQGNGVAFAQRSLAGVVGAKQEVHVMVVVQQVEAVPHAAFVL